MKRVVVLALALAGALTMFGPSAGAGGEKLVVDNDGIDCPNADYTTIQAAVTAAAPGDTIEVCPGVYHERVSITKNDLRLKAKSEDGRPVVVDGDQLMTPVPADFQLQNVSGVEIDGFVLRNGHEADILMLNADDNIIRHNVTKTAGHDGIELESGSSGNRIEHNVTTDNLAGNACGIQIRDAGSTGNVVRHNTAENNNWGIRIGLGATANEVRNNLSEDNRAFGILNFSGANLTVLEHNHVFDNPTGISVSTSSGVRVIGNVAFGNSPDLLWDGTGTNTFKDNHCTTSVPPGLCRGH
jgi:parallel beta-helix repeat protein